MITHTKEVKEYRKDGSLQYECTKAFIKPRTEHLYDKRIGNDGGAFIRINHATKYRKDGSIEWRLIYNNKGVVVGDEKGGLTNKDTFSQTRMAL